VGADHRGRVLTPDSPGYVGFKGSRGCGLSDKAGAQGRDNNDVESFGFARKSRHRGWRAVRFRVLAVSIGSGGQEVVGSASLKTPGRGASRVAR